MAEKNFKVSLTLDEANQVREALRLQQEEIMARIDTATVSDKHKVGIIDTLLRRDFG